MSLPGITALQGIGSIYRAVTVTELLAIAAEHIPDGHPWCLVWPGVPDRQIMISSASRDPVDDLVSGQISQIPLPNPGIDFTNDTWTEWGGERVLDLLSSQFPWAERTVVMAVAKRAQTSIAVVGITGEIPTDRTKAVAIGIIGAVENLAKVGHLRREAAMYRWLLESPGEALVVVNETGQVVAGTPEGFDALHKVEYGDRRSPFKRQEPVIPADLLSAVECGSTRKLHGIEISGSAFGRDHSDLTEPLIVLKFTATPSLDADRVEPAKLLTPTQFDVFRHLVDGLRYKEIAVRMGISIHTVHRHTSDVLRRLGCSDRLELFVRHGRSVTTRPQGKVYVPLVPLAAVITDLPYRIKSKRT